MALKIGILTSTRADFGIYIPFLRKLLSDNFFEMEVIAFGTHLSKKNGYTINEIAQQGFEIRHRIQTAPEGDTPKNISEAIGHTITKFANFWQYSDYDLVFALGDRYEMFAAVSAASPFNIKIAHLHGGETTLGAIDNAYRHSISLMSQYVFVSTEEYKKRAIAIMQQPEKVFNVGALSVDNLKKTELFSKTEFLERFDIDLNQPTILSTFHPETISLEKNKDYITELLKAFDVLKKSYQIVLTMPNADTMGLMVRNEITKYAKEKKKIILVESFGMRGYLSCMKYSSFLLGNTSSGFVEASVFPKWVINLGDRQKGRILSKNIFSIPITESKILETVKIIENSTLPKNMNIYGDGNSAEKIIRVLKNIYK